MCVSVCVDGDDDGRISKSVCVCVCQCVLMEVTNVRISTICVCVSDQCVSVYGGRWSVYCVRRNEGQN